MNNETKFVEHRKMRLSENLEKLIKSKGVSISKLAEITGVPAQTIFNWEGGAKPRNIEQLKEVAGFFGLTIDSICFDDLENEVSRSDTWKSYSEEINAGVFEVVLRRVKK